MRRVARVAAAVALFALAAVAWPARTTAAEDSLVVHARVAHVGDGSTLRDVAVVTRRGAVAWVGPRADARAPAGARVLACDVLVPGLVATVVVPEETLDTPSQEPERLAVDLVDPAAADRWLDAGVTALALSPGRRRLVAGRGGVVRLVPGRAPVVHLRRGALVASLEPLALDPPLRFEPVLRPSVDRPLEPALPQRPFTRMAAIAELRRGLERGRGDASTAGFGDVAAGLVPLRVAASRESDVRAALDLSREAGARLVVEGAAEAWKVAGELAAAGAMVALDVPDPAAPARVEPDVETRPDAATVLARAGVRVALAARSWSDAPDPLLVAASAVRLGLSPEQALAGLTGHAAAAMGAGDLGLLAAGSPADLVGFDVAPLAAGARPSWVVVGGRVVREPATGAAGDPAGPPLLVRAGRILTGETVVDDGAVFVRDGRIASVGTGFASPAGTRVLDLGGDAFVVPGFVDAWSRAGLPQGPPPAASPRTRALESVEPGDRSLQDALAAGVTVALVAPAARGSVPGAPCVIGTGGPDAAGGDAPGRAAHDVLDDVLDVRVADAGLAFVLDEGPGDDAPRRPRLAALRDLLAKAKAYADARAPKKPAEPSPSGGAATPRARRAPEKPPETDLALEPYRPLFAGTTRAWLRAGRAEAILPALDAFDAHGLKPVLVGAEEADRVATELAARGVTVVLGPPFLRREDGEAIHAAATLRAAGVPVAFGSFREGGAALLPLAAAAAVRQGLPAEDALAALTTTAAAACGVAAESGRIAPGRIADLVAFDGDPLEASSRVLLVIARGRVAWSRDAPEGPPGTGAAP